MVWRGQGTGEYEQKHGSNSDLLYKNQLPGSHLPCIQHCMICMVIRTVMDLED